MRSSQRNQDGNAANAVILNRNEWDFRPGPDLTKETKKGNWAEGFPFDFLPENESYYCWQYEFSRYDTPSFEFYSKWRAGAQKPIDFDSLLEHYRRTDPDGKNGYGPVVNWFYKIWPEWPEKPYLSIPFKERQRRFKEMWVRVPKRQLRLISLRDIYRFVDAVKAGTNPQSIIPGRIHQTKMEEDTWVIPRPSSDEKIPPIEIAAFELDFAMTDEQLVDRFHNWLRRRRKEKGYNRPDCRATRADRSDLIALGAMRLMESGLSIQKAMNHSEQISGKALYDDPGDWSHARKRAKEAIYSTC